MARRAHQGKAIVEIAARYRIQEPKKPSDSQQTDTKRSRDVTVSPSKA